MLFKRSKQQWFGFLCGGEDHVLAPFLCVFSWRRIFPGELGPAHLQVSQLCSGRCTWRPPTAPSQYQVSGLVELTDSILQVFYTGIQIPFYPAHGHTIRIANTWISSSRERSGLVCFEVYRGADCSQYWEKVTKIRY